MSALEMELRRGATRRSHVENVTRGDESASLRVAERELSVLIAAGRMVPLCTGALQAAEAARHALGAGERARRALGAVQAGRALRARRGCADTRVEESKDLGPVCTASLSVSEISLRLSWGEHAEAENTVGLFALMRVGAQVNYTELELTQPPSRQLTINTPARFEEVDHGFCLTLEVYASCLGLVGPNVGDWSPCERHGETRGQREVRYELVAQATLTLEDVHPHLATHQLLPTTHGVPCLPVPSCVSLRVSALPACVSAHAAVSGWLTVQREGAVWSRMHCVVSAGELRCSYSSPREVEAVVEPAETLTITRDMRVTATERGASHSIYSLSLTRSPSLACSPASSCAVGSVRLQADSRRSMEEWETALRRHLRDMARWGECADRPMVMAAAAAEKSYFPRKCRGDSESKQQTGSPAPSGEATPPWTAFFDDSRPRLVERRVNVSPLPAAARPLAEPRRTSPRLAGKPGPATPTAGVKRRAPPPPTVTPTLSEATPTSMLVNAAVATPSRRVAPPSRPRATPTRSLAPPAYSVTTPTHMLSNGAVATPILCVAPPTRRVAPPARRGGTPSPVLVNAGVATPPGRLAPPYRPGATPAQTRTTPTSMSVNGTVATPHRRLAPPIPAVATPPKPLPRTLL